MSDCVGTVSRVDGHGRRFLGSFIPRDVDKGCSGIKCILEDPASGHSSRICTMQSAPIYDRKEIPQKNQKPAVLPNDDSGNWAPKA